MTISYDLAKKLKDAGFPLKNTYGADLDMFADDLSVEIDGNTYLIPTLSEIILACGKDFESLSLNIFTWSAIGTKNGERIVCLGFSSEFAVANLWLALKK